MGYGIDPAAVPHRALRDGTEIPAIGLGTFGSDHYMPRQVADAVCGAVRAGYRLIDCASVYQNEALIGECFHHLFQTDAVPRGTLFVISKVWNNQHRQVRAACEKSLRDLGLDYLDLYVIHWPFPNYHEPGCSGNARSADARPFSTEEFMDTWRQCEELVRAGLVRHIGMSNMTVAKLDAVLPLCDIQPAALEMEMHPAFQQPELFKYIKRHAILPIAFCPLGSPSRPERDRADGDIPDMRLPAVVRIADAHGIHPALVCLKWAVQHGQIPIAFSVKEPQYIGNLKCVTENPLTPEEMEEIRRADKNCRLIKGQVFLWKGAKGWEDLWDPGGHITR